MTTVVSNTKTQPAIEMDKLHIDSFTLKQDRINDPNRIIGMSGTLYGLDVNGDKVFDNETVGVSDPDLDTTIVTAHVTAGGTFESFVAEYTAAKVQVNDAMLAGTLSDAQLMAYFESALGRIFELHNKINVAGVE